MERPIIFNDAMSLAVVELRKTVTRRPLALKHQKHDFVRMRDGYTDGLRADISNWIESRAWQIEYTPEAVYREIVGPTKVWALCHQDGSTPDLFARESRAIRARGFCAHSRVEECEVLP